MSDTDAFTICPQCGKIIDFKTKFTKPHIQKLETEYDALRAELASVTKQRDKAFEYLKHSLWKSPVNPCAICGEAKAWMARIEAARALLAELEKK